MSKYEILIGWSKEDRLFIAEAPQLAGCIAHGATEAEARANINKAIELWLATAKAFGDAIPEPKQDISAT